MKQLILLTRRDFFSSFSPLLTVLLTVAMKPQRAFSAIALKLIDENVPQVKGLRFTQDAVKSTTRKNLQATCTNCKQWLKKAGDTKEIDGIPVANCLLFQGLGYAKGTGWCMAWTLNPKAPKAEVSPTAG